jgi:hypothetical protein
METRYPARLRVGTEEFELRADLRSVRRGAGKTAALAVMGDDEGGTLAVYEGAPRGNDAPVYAVGKGGPLAVPTGLIFVRLKEGVRPEARRAEFANAGFRIARTLPYAPNAAWLRATRGGVEAALSRLESLSKVPGVVHAEPQMLLERALK